MPERVGDGAGCSALAADRARGAPQASDSISYVGPMKSIKTDDVVILCAECDWHTMDVKLELLDVFDQPRQCVKAWLKGQLLTIDDDGQSTACECFLDDPFPSGFRSGGG